jgi:hypothetical protein
MSGGAERYIAPEAVEALHRLRGEFLSPILAAGPVLEIFIPGGGVPRDVQHGLGVIPTGFITIAVQGGNVQCDALANWTAEIAFLTADDNDVRVRGYFVLTEVPIDA